MTNPSDPWGLGASSPTEKFGEPGESGQAHAAEHSEGYGAGGEQGEPYQYFEPPAGPNTTRELPPYQSQWGVYDTPGIYETRPYDAQWAGSAETGHAPGGPTAPLPPPTSIPPTMYGPPTQFGPPGGPPRRNRMATWIAVSLGIFAVVVLAAAALGFFLAGHDSSNSASPPAAVPTSAPFPVFPQTPGNPGIPQLPGADGLGATMGTVSANDGSTLTIDSLSGATVTVHTDNKTQVIAAISSGTGALADLRPGDMVVVQGDKNPDGSILAKIIIGTAVSAQSTPVPTPTR